MFGRIKRYPIDISFSQLVREAADWTCESCGRYFPDDKGRAYLHCSHFYSRKHKLLRWHPMNVAAHCAGCHDRLGKDPIVFNSWIFEYLGEENYEALKKLKQVNYKISKAEKLEIHLHIKAELRRIKQLRAEGEQGSIVLVPWFNSL